MEEVIEQYLDDWGEHVLLGQILAVCREKNYLEKRITALEVSNLHSENSQTDSLQATLPQLPSVKLLEPQSRSRNPSLAVQPEPEARQEGSSSSLSESSSEIEEETDTSSKLRMFRTKNSLSRKVVHF